MHEGQRHEGPTIDSNLRHLYFAINIMGDAIQIRIGDAHI